MKNKHIIQLYLEHVSFPFTQSKLKGLIQNTPLSNTFWGIRCILKEYHIDSAGIRMNETDVSSLIPPFIVQLKNQDETYALLTGIDGLQVEYKTLQNDCIKISCDEFQHNWTGMVLYPEITSESKENNLFLNKIVSFFSAIRIPIVILTSFLLILFLFIDKSTNVNILHSLLILCYVSGILTCVGLLVQEIDKDSPFVKKVCNTYKKADCVGVMESNASKLFGLVGWSEIGFVFFSGSLLVLILLPSCHCFLFWVHASALLYTIWSVVYQWKVIRIWCTLCLYVQLILWMIFSLFLYGKFYLYPLEFRPDTVIRFFACYIFPIVCLWFILPLAKQAYQFPFVSYQLKKLKSNDNIFHHLLNDQKNLNLEPAARNIVFGNANASFILTIITNPYCHHCAAMHKRLISLLQKYGDQIRLEIVFAGDEYSQEIIKFLIAAYCGYGKETAEKIYSDWFVKKEPSLIKKYPVSDQNMIDFSNTIYVAQKAWKDTLKQVATPSIYINDHELPEEYHLEDIIYFI